MGWPYQQKPPMGWPLDYSSGLVPNAGFWLFNEGSGNIVQDLSGNGNTGTITLATWEAGKFGSALKFVSGTNHSILVPVETGTSHTILAWIKASADGRIFDSQTGRVIFDIDGGYLQYYAAGWNADTTKIITDNKWHQVVASIVNGTALTIYVDGVPVYSNTVVASSIGGTTRIGNHYTPSTSEEFIGLIDHKMIYNRGLSASEISQCHQEPFCMFKDPAELVLMAGNQAVVTIVPQIQYLRNMGLVA